MTEQQLIITLQTAISPVVLISGIGLLLLSMTNRFGRSTDRARSLLAERHDTQASERRSIDAQIRILFKRSRIMLIAISLALSSILFAALLIAVLFLNIVLHAPLETVVVILFALCLLALIASITFFIMDISLSLQALKKELGEVIQ